MSVEGAAPSHRSGSRLGLLDATMIGMGAMIGAGIFVLTGLAAETVGPSAIIVFVLNGVVTAFTALSYAELATAIPENGGGFAYVKEVFPESVAFVVGWMFWFAYMIAGALYALGFASNFEEFLHLTGVGWSMTGPVLAFAVVAAFAGLNAVSTSASGSAETVITVAKVAILLVFVAFGVSTVRPDAFSGTFAVSTAALLPAMGFTFIAFQGYDLIATVTEEVENPRKNVPRAILLSLLATVLVYLLVVSVAVGTVGAEQLGRAGETAIAVAADSFMPAIPGLVSGGVLIAFGAVFSTVSALNAVVLASSRVVFSMGRARLLPSRLGRRHAFFGTPLLAVLASSAVVVLAVALAPIQLASNLASLFFLLSFVVVNASAIRLRRAKPDLQRPYEMPLYPLPPLLGIGLNLLLGLFIAPRTWIIGLGWLALGVGVYLAYSKLVVDERRAWRGDDRFDTIDPEAIQRRVNEELAALDADAERYAELSTAIDDAVDEAIGTGDPAASGISEELRRMDELAEANDDDG